MERKARKLLLIVCCIFGGLILINIGKKIIVNYLFSHYKPPAVTVSVAKVRNIKSHTQINTVGTFVAINGVEINSQVSGIITKIYFQSGQFINKGEKLLDLDDTVEVADFKLNQANLTLQAAEFKRQKELQAQNATSLANLDSAQAKLLEAQARVEKIEALIKQKHITAPFSGFLGVRKVNIGEFLKPGETSIVSLQTLDPIYLKFFIPEHLINKIKIDKPIAFAVEQYSNKKFFGKITAINSISDKNTHSIEVQAKVANCQILDNKNPPLKCSTKGHKNNKISKYFFIPGSFANVFINAESKKNALAVPSTAISHSVSGDSIFIIEKLPKKNLKKEADRFIAKKIYVTTGARVGLETIIKPLAKLAADKKSAQQVVDAIKFKKRSNRQFLKAGLLVVNSGEFKLEDGSEVSINNDIPLPKLSLTQLGY